MLRHQIMRMWMNGEPTHTGMLCRAQGCLLDRLAAYALGGIVEFGAPQNIPGGVRVRKAALTWPKAVNFALTGSMGD